jgi:hypothetical protein
MMAAALSALRGVRWYIRAATGVDKWDEYLDRCRVSGETPMPAAPSNAIVPTTGRAALRSRC